LLHLIRIQGIDLYIKFKHYFLQTPWIFSHKKSRHKHFADSSFPSSPFFLANAKKNNKHNRKSLRALNGLRQLFTPKSNSFTLFLSAMKGQTQKAKQFPQHKWSYIDNTTRPPAIIKHIMPTELPSESSCSFDQHKTKRRTFSTPIYHQREVIWTLKH